MVSAAGKDQSSVCSLCDLGRSERRLDVLSGTGTVAFRDRDLVALVVKGHPGALLVPCRHVRNLAGLPDASGAILAGLTRAMRAVTASYGAPGATVEPTTDIPGAPGHVGYWVIPTAEEDGPPSGANDDRPARGGGPDADGPSDGPDAAGPSADGPSDGPDARLLRTLADELRSLPPPEGWRVSTAGQSAGA